MDPLLIQFFHAAVPDAPPARQPFRLQEDALKRGYIVPLGLLTADVEAFIERLPLELNTTFYRRWQDVVEKDRLQLFMDQILHYASTYGSCFTQEGNGYVPNEGAETPEFKEYTVIVPITEEALYQRCLALVQGKAALKSDTVAALCRTITDHLAAHPWENLDINAIANREALSILCKALGKRPTEPVSLLRYMVYEATGETLLIQSNQMLQIVRRHANGFDFRTLLPTELDALASIFYRFKNLFLAFRTLEETKKGEVVLQPSVNRQVINRLRRAAPALHTPMQVGFWERLLASRVSETQLCARLGEASAFKLVTLLQAIRERLLLVPGDQQMYLIRNGSAWFQPVPERQEDTAYLQMLERVLREQLIRLLAAKACTVRFPDKLELTCPSSEKNFLGNLPFGSSYPIGRNNFFGIYWRNEWGTEDFDLSFLDWTGVKTGWNAEYNTGTTVYSGDMTSADPEAAELLYCKEGFPSGSIYVNRYYGVAGSRFRFFFGQQELTDITLNYMVDPNSLLLSEEMTSERREKMVGVVAAGRIWLMDVGVGGGRVSGGEDAGSKEAILARRAQSFLPLREVLLEAGFTESDTPELDLRQLKKDTLLALFG